MSDMNNNEPGAVDPQAQEIFHSISLAVHAFVKSKTSSLTDMLYATEPDSKITPDPVYQDDFDESACERYSTIYSDRLHKAETDGRPYVSPFAKDYARIIHSPSFRKLQGKSQLIPAGENYFFRTRLTHSLEVADIAVRIAKKINHTHPYFSFCKIDYDLVNCAALLHDLGHPPFGHTGEEALDQKMNDAGGFEGNAQTLRLVTRLENRLGRDRRLDDAQITPRGLNLTVGTLASIIKYDVERPLENDEPSAHNGKFFYSTEASIVEQIKGRLDVARSEKLRTIECQIMDFADDIAYSAYDLEDTLEAGIVTPFDFLSVTDELLERIRKDVACQYKKKGFQLPTNFSNNSILRELHRVFGLILAYADPINPYDMNLWQHRAVFVGRSHMESLLHAQDPLVRRQFLETLIESSISGIYVEFNRARPFLTRVMMKPERLLTLETLKAFNFQKVILSRKFQIPRHRGLHVVGGLFDILNSPEGRRLLSARSREEMSRNGKSDVTRK
jgi:dGTPase